MPSSRRVITTVIAADSVKRLGLEQGMPASAVFKASSNYLGLGD